jgi:hypothetical protein
LDSLLSATLVIIISSLTGLNPQRSKTILDARVSWRGGCIRNFLLFTQGMVTYFLLCHRVDDDEVFLEPFLNRGLIPKNESRMVLVEKVIRCDQTTFATPR